ncbi:Vesicle-associated membrane protein [Entamoeba marina]
MSDSSEDLQKKLLRGSMKVREDVIHYGCVVMKYQTVSEYVKTPSEREKHKKACSKIIGKLVKFSPETITKTFEGKLRSIYSYQCNWVVIIIVTHKTFPAQLAFRTLQEIHATFTSLNSKTLKGLQSNTSFDPSTFEGFSTNLGHLIEKANEDENDPTRKMDKAKQGFYQGAVNAANVIANRGVKVADLGKVAAENKKLSADINDISVEVENVTWRKLMWRKLIVFGLIGLVVLLVVASIVSVCVKFIPQK